MNAGYHTEVPVTDVWKEYARLRDEEGWKQEDIAKAKGTTQSVVSLRLKLNDISDTIKKFIVQGILNETQLKDFTSISCARYFDRWIRSEVILNELAEWAAKNKKNTRETKKECDRWKEFKCRCY